MKVKISEATRLQLNYLVAKCEGLYTTYYKGTVRASDIPNIFAVEYNPSTDWAQGGPIIEREKIDLKYLGYDNPPYWGAQKFSPSKYERKAAVGPTALIAAMRCYVASRLGDEVDIPEELA